MNDIVEPTQPAAAPAVGRPRRRKPWVAAILNFVVPGLGYLYAGLLWRAVLLFLLCPALALSVLMLSVVIPVPMVNLALPFALILLLYALLAGSAARYTRRVAVGAPVGRVSRWYSLVAAVVLVRVVVNPLWADAARTTFLEAYKIPSGAMEDTILIGDRLLVAKWAYGWRLPLFQGVVFGARQAERGELAVFRYPKDPTRAFIKRVIGLPGETVEIRRKVVFINGSRLEEPYARFFDPEEARQRDNWGPTIVPAESYFVLGDNRDNSNDSRFWGFVRQGDLLGRARIVYWSAAGPGTMQVRFGRIGRRLE